MGRREELIALEDRAWEEFVGIIGSLAPDDVLVVGVTPEWSVKDVMAHVGCWMAECAHVLERMRLETWELHRMDVEARNRWFYEACRDVDLIGVKSGLQSARVRMLQEWYALPEITPLAEEWFVDTGPGHLEEHVPDLHRFAESRGVSGTAGSRP